MAVSNITLIKIAAIGGFATAVMGYMVRGRIQDNIKTAPFYREALKVVRSNPMAVHLLGEPIKEGNIDVSKNKKNFVEGNKAYFEVPVRGPKQSGTIFLSAIREDDQWSLSHIELEVAKYPDKRLVILKNVNNK